MLRKMKTLLMTPTSFIYRQFGTHIKSNFLIQGHNNIYIYKSIFKKILTNYVCYIYIDFR